MPIETDRFEKVQIDSRVSLREWLERNHERTDSVWLVTWKKHTGSKYVSTSEILDELLCFGWIDGIRRKLDADRTMQLVSQRKVQHWAKSYQDRAARLIAGGLMQPSGLAKIEEAKASNRWDEMSEVDALRVPDDLRSALDASPPAGTNFDSSAPSYRRNVLRWIKLAKKPETRSRRITSAVEYAFRNDRMPQM